MSEVHLAYEDLISIGHARTQVLESLDAIVLICAFIWRTCMWSCEQMQ